AAACVGVAVALGTLATLPEYGVTSDEPVIYHGGERQWWAMWSDHPDRWDFRKPPPRDFQTTAPFSLHPDPRDVYRFPGFPGLFSVAVARLARFVPGYDKVDAVHAGIAVLHALSVFVMVLYLARLLGVRRAVLVATLYALFPTAVGHSHYNVKDWPATGFYALAVLAFGVGAIENRALYMVQAGAWLGLGLASKANPIFALPTVVLWSAFAGPVLYRGGRLPSRRTVAAACLIPWVALAVFYLAWPYLRAGTLVEQWSKLTETVAFFLRRGVSARDTYTSYPLLLLYAMTPPIELAGLLLAAILPFRGGTREAAVAALGWVWLAVPMVRMAWPHSNYYDANRHFLEYIPAVALLAASGLDLALGRVASGVRARHGGAVARRVDAGLIAMLVALAAWPVVQYHPYESTYYNVLVGGLGGAQSKPLTRGYIDKMEYWAVDSEGDYWGFSYRNAIRDMNRVAERGTSFHPCGDLLGPLTVFQKVRPDLRQTDRNQADYFIILPRRPFCSDEDQRYIRAEAEVVREERRDGGLIYGVYRRRRP
ncbi:MAG: ArnT family glycosyltransferase, partial [Candidatus Rokuibacteriota bacterium]